MPRRLAKAVSSWAQARTWATEPGRAVDVVGPEGLDRVEDGERRALGLERGQDVAEVGLGGELQRGLCQPEAAGAHADLGGGLLAGDVDRRGAAGGEGGGGLQQQGRLADAGVAADEDGRSRDEAAAEDAVELVDAGEAARQRRLGGGEVAKGDAAAAGRAERAGGGAGGEAGLLGDGIPGAAGLAAAGPLGVDSAALGADEGGASAIHGSVPSGCFTRETPVKMLMLNGLIIVKICGSRSAGRIRVTSPSRSGLQRGRG